MPRANRGGWKVFSRCHKCRADSVPFTFVRPAGASGRITSRSASLKLASGRSSLSFAPRRDNHHLRASA